MSFRLPLPQFAHRATPKSGLVIHTGIPKSGTTWLECMLADLLDLRIHDIGEAVHWPLPKLRAFIEKHRREPASARTHFPVSAHEVFYSYGLPIIFTYRHPGDLVTSLHRHLERHLGKGPQEFEKTLDHFEGQVAPKIGWRELPDVFVTRYEDLLHDTAAVLTELGRYLKTPFKPRRIEETVQKHSFEALFGRKPGVEDRTSRGRKGIIGDHVNFLVGDRLRLWQQRFSGIEEEWGYANSSVQAAQSLSSVDGSDPTDERIPKVVEQTPV